MTRRISVRMYAAVLLLGAASVLHPLEFEEVAVRIDHVESVWAARSQLDMAEQELRSAAFAGDYAFSATPSGSLSTDEQGIRNAAISASASFSVPVGLSLEAQDRLERAADALTAAERTLRDARDETYARLYRLYQDVWLAQEELDVLDAELELARRSHEIAEVRFAAGSITLNQLGVTAEALERARTARDQGTLAHRLAWLDLAFTAGLDPSVQLVLEPRLDFSDEPPKPPELSEWAVDHDAQIAAQMETVEALTAAMGRTSARVSASLTKLQISVFDHSLAVSYGFANPTVSASYSTPDLTLYSSSSATRDVVPFAVGISGTVSLGGRTGDDLERAGLAIELERAELRLEALCDALDFEIRGAYQQMHRSIDALAQVERFLRTARENQQIVQARADVGKAGAIDVLRAAVEVRRAEHDLTAAQIARENAMMHAVLAASYFSRHYPEISNSEGETE